MTSIRQIPLEDLKKIIVDNELISDTDEIYKLGWDLIKSGKINKAPQSVIDWIIAYNLLKKYPNIT
jgi:hypothetical protein